MRVVFFDKKRETYNAIENVTHMHIDFIFNKKVYVLYTETGVEYISCRHNDLHKIDT